MRLRIALPAWACLSLFILCAGCSRSKEAPQQEGPAIEPGPESTVDAEPAARPVAVARGPASTPARAAAQTEDDKPPFRVCALLNPQNGVARCGVIQNDTGFSRVLKEGDSFGGYRLASVDYRSESAVFQKGGAQVTLRLTRGAAEAAKADVPPFLQGAGSPPPTNGAFQGIDLAKMQPQKFEPADWEIEAGIDPNDSRTCPSGYRGPAIERLVRKYPPKNDQVNLPLESARKSGALEDK